MPLPLNDKQVGDIGHADDHNAIVNEINLLISASNNYLPISASNNFILVSSSAALATSIVSTIVDSAPSTLDTLNELAAAIGDDPNFAASTASAIGERLTSANASATYLSKVDAGTTYLPISASSNYLPTSSSSNYLPVSASSNYLQTANASATYAKLESPTFTGTPLAPTASSGTNTTQIATTEFVTSAVLAAQSGSVDLSSYLTITNASATYLPISSSSNYLQVNASANFLPISASSNYLPTSASSNYLPVSASSNYLPMSASNNFATATISINAQTGTSYTLAASDSGKIVEMNNAGANLVIIPLNSTVPIPVGTQIEIIQTGAGATSASIVSGVTLNSEAGKRTINAQWQGASLIKRATDTWVMMGAIKA